MILVLGLLLTFVAGREARHMTVANELESLLAGTEELAEYRGFLANWPSDEQVLVFFETRDFDAASLLALWDAEQALGSVEGVAGCSSVLRLLPERLRRREELRSWLAWDRHRLRLRSQASHMRLLRDLLLSRGERWLGLRIRLKGTLPKKLLLPRIRKVVEKALGDRPVHWLGYPVVEARVFALVGEGNRRLLPLSVAVGAAILYAFVGRIGPMVAAVCAVFASLVWLAGLFPHTGYAMNIFSTMLFPLVLSVGLATTVHVIMRYGGEEGREKTEKKKEKRDGGEHSTGSRVFRSLALPCGLSILTTALGFLSLRFGGLPEIRDFGVHAALGVLLSLLAVLVFLPPAFRLLPRGSLALAGRPGRLEPALRSLMARIVRHHRAVLLGFLVLFALSLLGMRGLRLSSASIDGLWPDDPIRVSKELYERAFSGVTALEALVETRGESLRSREGQLALQRLQRAFEGLGGIRSLSFADCVLDASSLLARRRVGSIPTKEEAELLVELLESGTGEDLTRLFVDATGRRGRIHLQVRPTESFALLALVEALKRAGGPVLPKGWTLVVTGRNLMSALTHRNTIANEIRCFVLSLSLIAGIICLCFRSLSVGLVALAPNLFPILGSYGLLGVFRGRFDIASGMIACITIGIVVDDTLHVLVRYREARARGLCPAMALDFVASVVGRPIVLTSLILVAGMLVLAWAPFAMIAVFGIYGALTIALALLGDILLLPALLVAFPTLLSGEAMGSVESREDAR